MITFLAFRNEIVWHDRSVCDSERIGSETTSLIVIRGNSGSGKSPLARGLRLRYGRGWALVEQDYLRRVVLRERRDLPGGIAPDLIAQTVRFAFDNSMHVVLEGIMVTLHYGEMIKNLLATHRGRSFVFYLDVSLEETLSRHATRPQAKELSAEDMRTWYLAEDLLGVPDEHIIPETSSLTESLERIAVTVGFPH